MKIEKVQKRVMKKAREHEFKDLVLDRSHANQQQQQKQKYIFVMCLSSKSTYKIKKTNLYRYSKAATKLASSSNAHVTTECY